METKETYAHHGEEGSLEWFLRRNFGLKGAYYSAEFEAVLAKIEKAKTEKARDAIADKWYDAPDWEPAKNYSPEAMEAWDRALKMVDDLVTMGLISEDGMRAPANRIRDGFCDNS